MSYIFLKLKIIFFRLIGLINVQERLVKKIQYLNHNYFFYTPNYLNNYRAITLLTKEPETIEWIKGFKKNKIFYDIGANIGLYSVFASKEMEAQSYAFEPSILNLELLYKNITINRLNHLINIIPISLTESNQVSQFKLSNLDKGGALSAFDVNYDQFGKKFIHKNYYNAPGITLNKCVDVFNMRMPNYIKIDVDGIEHLILKGGEKIIREAESILIETTEHFKESYDFCQKILISNKFELISKNKNPDEPGNQIWVKKIVI